MANVAEWKPLGFKSLDSRKFDQPLSRDIGGVSVTAYASPYDVPEAINVYSSPDRRYYRIEFKYIGSEEEDKWATGKEHVGFWLGHDSRRLYAIDFDAKHTEAEEIGEVLGKLANEPHHPPRIDNYQVAKNVVEWILPSLLNTTRKGSPLF